MKYSRDKPPIQCMMTQSTCYRQTVKMVPVGVLIHSTGANNPTIKRYVQPDDNAPDRAALLELIGKNAYGNDWNHTEHNAGLNGWLGKLADGTIATVQTMPWDFRPWGCGSGKFGSCNTGWIQFEVCEDGLSDPDYFNRIYEETIQFVAYLCKLYGIDPHGTVNRSGHELPTILCHQDSYQYGFGCNHGDVLHWFPKYGKSMDVVRADVAALLKEPEVPDMIGDRYNTINKLPSWAYPSVKKLCDKRILQGNGSKDANGNPAGLDLSLDMVRLIVLMDRGKIFD